MHRFCAILLLATLAPPARGAVVYFKDGSRVSGKIVAATASDLTILLPEGTLTISSDRIERVDYAQPSEIPPSPPEPAAPARPVAPPEMAADYRQIVTPAVGFGAPVSSVHIAGGTLQDGYAGALTGVQYFFFHTKRLGVGVDFTYFNRAQTDEQSFLPNISAKVSGDTTILLAALRYELRDEGLVRPFLLAGAGGAYNTLTIDARPVWGATWSDTGTFERRRVVDGAAWTPAVTLRGGLDFVFMRRMLLSGELGWTALAGARYRTTVQGQALGLGNATGPLNAVVFAARWGWRF